MLTIIYPYRNRESNRVKASLESLKSQTNKDFEVFFVDYGSVERFSKNIVEVCREYDFVKYRYYPSLYQPWNKAKALNSVIKDLNSKFCFVADVDIIFHPGFVTKALEMQNLDKVIYFQVGFLTEEETKKNSIFKEFHNYSKYRKSDDGATGMSLFPVSALQKLRGFDEFYHFWGAEDTDMHVRLINAGYEIEFYDKEVFLLHQAHTSYRTSERRKLTKELQISGIVQLNQQHLNFAREQKRTGVNNRNWGKCINITELKELLEVPVTYVLHSEQRKIDDLLFGQLPQIRNKIIKIKIIEDPFKYSIKYRIKKILGKKVPKYYTLKEVNDKVLLHLISFYRDTAYTFKIKNKLTEIELCIKL